MQIMPEDERVGKVIVGEFKHFKDVLTVVWNTQTAVTQRDVSATVKDVVGKKVVVQSENAMRHDEEKVDQEGPHSGSTRHNGQPPGSCAAAVQDWAVDKRHQGRNPSHARPHLRLLHHLQVG